MSVVFLDGKFVKAEDAKISIQSHALHYSSSCFEGIRGNWNDATNFIHIFRLEEHYKRLKMSADTFYIDIPYSVQKLCDLTCELAERAGYQKDVYIRPIAYKSSTSIGLFDLRELEDGFAIMILPMENYLELDVAISCMTSSWTKPADTAIPSGTKVGGMYTTSLIAKTDAVAKGYDEALLLNTRGTVSECSGENIFMLKDGVLYTPPTSDNCLGGITRDTIMTLVRDVFSMEVRERSILRNELYYADEVLLCGTAAHITGVGSIDGKLIGSGEMGDLTKKLQKLYFEVIRGKNETYTYWTTPVKM